MGMGIKVHKSALKGCIIKCLETQVVALHIEILPFTAMPHTNTCCHAQKNI